MKLRFADDIATGLVYLHSKNILHRDLKSLNVLLTANYEAKLSDFGLAKVKSTNSSMSKGQGIGTLAWMAPELIEEQPNTQQADVYSYGVVLWEIAARQVPFANASNPMLVGLWVSKDKREKIPEDCPQPFAALISRCWTQRQEDRPKINEALEDLRTKVAPTVVGGVKTLFAPSAASAPVVGPGPASGPQYAFDSKKPSALASGPQYAYESKK